MSVYTVMPDSRVRPGINPDILNIDYGAAGSSLKATTCAAQARTSM